MRSAPRRALALALGLAAVAAVAAPAATAEVSPDRPRAWLGIGFEDLDGAARVTEVHPGTAAAAAGLQPDDVIIGIAGRALGFGVGLPDLLAELPIGTRLPIVFLRDGRRLRVATRLTARPSDEEIVYQRLIDRAVPTVEPVDRLGKPVPASERTRRPQVWTVFDVQCDRCADAAAALGRGLADAADGGPGVPLRVVLIGGADETAAYLARVPVLGTVWRVERDRQDGGPMLRTPVGRRLLSGVAPERDGVVLVMDAQGVVRFATALSAGEAAHDGACAAAAAVDRAWRR